MRRLLLSVLVAVPLVTLAEPGQPLLVTEAYASGGGNDGNGSAQVFKQAGGVLWRSGVGDYIFTLEKPIPRYEAIILAQPVGQVDVQLIITQATDTNIVIDTRNSGIDGQKIDAFFYIVVQRPTR